MISVILNIAFAIIIAVFGYNGYYSKYKTLLNTIYNALKDGKITEQEIHEILIAYEDTKNDSIDKSRYLWRYRTLSRL